MVPKMFEPLRFDCNDITITTVVVAAAFDDDDDADADGDVIKSILNYYCYYY